SWQPSSASSRCSRPTSRRSRTWCRRSSGFGGVAKIPGGKGRVRSVARAGRGFAHDNLPRHSYHALRRVSRERGCSIARLSLVVALGGEAQGFSLHLTDGVPTFAVRSEGKLTVARAEDRMPRGRWVHLIGVLDADGRLRVWVDGKPSGDAVQGAHLTKMPADGL